MSSWVKKGLKTGIVTTHYPKEDENAPGISPGFPSDTNCDKIDSETLLSSCPTNALYQKNHLIKIEPELCVHCYRCLRNIEKPLTWDDGFKWATMKKGYTYLPKEFRNSIHILVVDAGDCGACLNEVKLLNNPFYNMHRLGFFITPSPRKADVLLVVGPVTEHMKTALLKAYKAMPTPKRVMAVGACSLNAGVFKDSFVVTSGVEEILPVDIKIPGCPPPPLAILDGLLTLMGDKKGKKYE
ncbi:MAG: hypothetical protein GXP61_06020 [Epsilonproteobacteria bacterium]|nr:hypothetical protein [Campylobacterota bacterium]